MQEKERLMDSSLNNFQINGLAGPPRHEASEKAEDLSPAATTVATGSQAIFHGYTGAGRRQLDIGHRLIAAQNRSEQLDMLGSTPTAGADDRHPGLAHAVGMGRHHPGVAVVGQGVAGPHRDSGVGFGDDGQLRSGGLDLLHRRLCVGDVVAAVGADGDEIEGGESGAQLVAGHAHHRPARGIERHGGRDRQLGGGTSADNSRLDFVEIAHRLYPQQVGSALG